MPHPDLTRRLSLLAAAALAIGLLAWKLPTIAGDSSFLKPYDFVQYWAAGRLALDGGDPYSAEALLPWERYVGWVNLDPAILMWNPPWVLPAVMPLATLTPRFAQLVWFALHLGTLLLCGDCLWRLYGGPDRLRWIAWGLTLMFAPSVFALIIGQISAFLLLGVVGFVVQMKANRPVAAGCFAALTAIKPHLFLLFALLLALEAFRVRAARKAIAAGAGLLVVAGAIPLLWNADVWSQYIAAVLRPPSLTHVSMAQWDHPTLGFLLRQAVPGHPFWVQFVPLALSIPVVAVYWWHRRNAWDWTAELPRIVLVSALTACYGAWAFDLVILLPTVISTAMRLRRMGSGPIFVAAGIYFTLNVVAIASIGRAYSQENYWIVPAVLAAYVAVIVFVPRGEAPA